MYFCNEKKIIDLSRMTLHGHKSISGFTVYKTENIIQMPEKLEEERGKVKKVSCFIEPISFGLTQRLLMGAKNFLSSQRSSSSRPIE